MLTTFPYIIIPALANDLKADVMALLQANNKPKTFTHAKAVAEMNISIAERYGVDRELCELCGYLHDISAVVSPDDMLRYSRENDWTIDEAERQYPFLLHQRIARVIAEQDFGITDERVLSAIECHSTLKANPSAYDMALFVADKLAWDQVGRPPFFAMVNDALDQSLAAASLAYMDYIVANRMILYPHKWFEEGVRSLRTTLKTHVTGTKE